MTTNLLDELLQLDFSRLAGQKRSALADVQDRVEARVARFTPMTVADRLEAFVRIGFRPHGLYVPTDGQLKSDVLADLKRIGAIPLHDERLQEYVQLQDRTQLWERDGTSGQWTGQQAVARSSARFRLVAWGRRSGKSFYASREAMAVATSRPRSWVWVAAPTMKLVSRIFDMMIELVTDLGIESKYLRNSLQEKLIVLANGSKIEGISLERPESAAGASVDFAIVDEAAQITEDAWYRAILPPLADRNGHALLISSWEGEGGFFHDKATDIQTDGANAWEMFTGPSWENFFEFPQGRADPKVTEMEKEQSPLDFLEQFGAIPARAKERVYPEFKENVHVGKYAYKPGHPVKAAADPSGGANPYAVLAIQDFGDIVVVVDEFYVAGAMVEDIVLELDKRPWRKDVTDMVVDSAWPADIERWGKLGWPAYPVFEKPKEEESIPFVKRLLRDPHRFYAFHRQKVDDVMAEFGYNPGADVDLSVDVQRALALKVEERLSDENLTHEDVETLKGCARLFIAEHCVNTIHEFKFHSFQRRRSNRDPREKPKDSLEHALDCCRYWAWTHKRFEEADRVQSRSYLHAREILKEIEVKEDLEFRAVRPWRPGMGFLPEMRGRFLKNNEMVRSYLITGSK